MNLNPALRFSIIIGALCILSAIVGTASLLRMKGIATRKEAYLNVSTTLASLPPAVESLREKAFQEQTPDQQALKGLFMPATDLLNQLYEGSYPIVSVTSEQERGQLKEALYALASWQESAWSGLSEWKELNARILHYDSVETPAAAARHRAAVLAYAEIREKAEQRLDDLRRLMEAEAKGQASLSAYAVAASLILFLAAGAAAFLVFLRTKKDFTLISDFRVAIQREDERVERLSGFIESVSAGQYQVELDTSDETDNLSRLLVKMKNKLKDNAEEDRKRNWTTSGLAQIGDILRGNANAEALYDQIIKFVVKYTHSSQGGLFILNDEDEESRMLELCACYAFERKKFIQKKLDIGEGLVGQCFLEGQRIHLKEVPEAYVSITSGLGGSTPRSVLLVPLKVNDKIFGVIELASFRYYEDYEMVLVEKLGESIASAISNVRVNDKTRILLEQTQQQAEEMKAQEEEIRQNMEELEATQEEMRRKQLLLEEELKQSQQQSEMLRLQEVKLTHSQDTLQAIVDNIPRAIFWKDRELRFLGCNKIFANIAGAASPQELIGKSDYDMAWSAQADAYRKDDQEVMASRRSKLDIEEVNISSEGTESWVRTSKVPVVDQHGELVAILGMFEDITAWKLREKDIQKKLTEREQLLAELEDLKKRVGVNLQGS